MAETRKHPRLRRFGPFRLDPAERLLFHRHSQVALRPKTIEVLLLLLEHAGQVVTKADLLRKVWQGAAVSDYVLTTCISELRSALGDDAKEPRYLKTVHRSGYQLLVVDEGESDAPPSARVDRPPLPTPSIVGRQTEIARLRRNLELAEQGQRQVVFVTGEMGIGKTTLADELFRVLLPHRDATREPAALAARGQCIDQFGAGEPYMPVFEAIGRLGRTTDAPLIVETLRRHAPALLVQIPGLLPPQERIDLRRELPPETQEHLLRLIADGIEALSEQRLLALVLEDLHLSDPATLELVAALALRRSPARLLIVGTFRSAERFERSSPFQALKHQLLLHRQCDEIALTPLTPASITDYLGQRFGELEVAPELSATIHARTEGNPLFVARLVDQLFEEGLLTPDDATRTLRCDAAAIATHVPSTLRAMIEQRTESLSAEESLVLEAASVAGVQFAAATVAAAAAIEREIVEQICTRLHRRDGFLAPGELSDPSGPDLGGRYTFSHALYQQVVYERIEITRRRRLHGLVGQALRSAWRARESEVAAEIASHFERGGNLATAIELYDKAGVATALKGADREAVGYLDRALALLALEPETDARRQSELDLLMTRGPSVLATAGHGSDEALANYQRALDLSRYLGNFMRQLTCLAALSVCQQTRANLAGGEALAVELTAVAHKVGFPEPVLAQLRNPLSQVRLYQGRVEEALALSDAAVAALELFQLPAPPPDARPALWADPGVLLHCQRAAASVAHGRLGHARDSVEQALALSRDLRHPFNIAYASSWAALYYDIVGRWADALTQADQAIEASRSYGFPFWAGVAMIFRGHAMARSGDVAAGERLLREGLETWSGTGGRLAMSMYCNLLADVCLAADDIVGAESALDRAEGHATTSGERIFLAETLRLRAECRRRAGAPNVRIDDLFGEAINLAGQQGTRLWELRAASDAYALRRSARWRRLLEASLRAFRDEPPSVDVTRALGLLGS